MFKCLLLVCAHLATLAMSLIFVILAEKEFYIYFRLLIYLRSWNNLVLKAELHGHGRNTYTVTLTYLQLHF